MKHLKILKIFGTNRNRIKILTSTLGLLSLMVAIVSAGNISGGTSDNATTQPAATATLILPVEGTKYDATVPVEYTVSGTVQFKVDGSNIAEPGSGTNITLSEGDHDLTIVDAEDGTVLAMANFSVDITPPAEVVGLTETDSNRSSITWNWTNPSDSDLANIIVNVTKTSNGAVIVPDTRIGKVETYQATGLNAGTEYTIVVKTEDDAVS